MKRYILAFGVALAAMFAAGASAQEPAAPRECSLPPCAAGCSARPGCRAAAGNCPVFDGLNLTDAQKQQIAAICEQCRGAGSCDSVAGKCNRQSRLDNLHKIKAVLTPDQYVAFLENIVSVGAMRHKMHMSRCRSVDRTRMMRGACRTKCADMQKAGKCPKVQDAGK